MSFTKLPVGTIASLPLDGGTWLQMNGQVATQATYPELFKQIGHQPEFDWKVSNTWTASGTVCCVAYGNAGTYVAVGTGGIVATSTDMLTWTSQTSGVATGLNAVAWDATNSLFIAVGASNVILTSPTGVTWTSRTSGVTSTLNNVVVAGGRAVAVGSAGWISYSTNGTTWTATQPNSGPNYGYLLYKNSKWFTVAANAAFSNGLAYSNDGITWSYVAKPTTNNARFLGYNGTYYYVIDNSVGTIFRSTDGASWASVAPTAGQGVLGGVSNDGISFPANSTISLPGQFIGYTDDGFTTVKPLRYTENTKWALTNSGFFLNPLVDSSMKFAIALVQGGGPLACSVDGKTWSLDAKFNYAGIINQFRQLLVNGRYVTGGSSPNTVSATAPYDPSTNFQIPSRTDNTGTALYIKAA